MYFQSVKTVRFYKMHVELHVASLIMHILGKVSLEHITTWLTSIPACKEPKDSISPHAACRWLQTRVFSYFVKEYSLRHLMNNHRHLILHNLTGQTSVCRPCVVCAGSSRSNTDIDSNLYDQQHLLVCGENFAYCGIWIESQTISLNAEVLTYTCHTLLMPTFLILFWTWFYLARN